MGTPYEVLRVLHEPSARRPLYNVGGGSGGMRSGSYRAHRNLRRGHAGASTCLAASRGLEWAAFSGPLTAFLAGVLARRGVCPVFPNDFPSDAPAFTQAAG